MLNISKIVKTYSGKIGCMCGCKGKYSYTPVGAEKFGPGYDVNVSERSVRIIAKKVLADPNCQWEDNIAFVEDRAKGTIRAIYFQEAL